MKKMIIITVVLVIICCTACGNELPGVVNIKDASGNDNIDDLNDKLDVVVTIFPEYDWVREILGDKIVDADITLLSDNGVDMHSYQPSVEDIATISDCDVFIYVGGESDKWVNDIIQNTTNKDMRVVNLLQTLENEVKEEEIVEGMEKEEDFDDGESESIEYDEHVWLSLRNSQILCNEIAKALGQADPDDADLYKANADAYNDKLAELDKKYSEAVDNAGTKTILFGDRFPFRYLADDYDIDYYAAFAGCSAETEASFETVTFLAGKVDELNLGVVLTIENSDGKIAQTIIDNTRNKDQKMLTMNSIQSVTAKDIEDGVTYIKLMEDNLEVLKEAVMN